MLWHRNRSSGRPSRGDVCVGGRWAAALSVGLAVSGALATQPLGDLSGPWILLVDDYPVDHREQLARTYHPFEKYPSNPVLEPTEPWEDSIAYIYGTVLPEESGNGLRMWYHTMRPEDPDNDGSNILYATSPDGITWTKPNLGIRSWHGSTANNMIYNRPGPGGITSVMHTPWELDPARRYTFMNYDIGGYWGAWSPDGVHTVDVPGNPVLTGGGDVGQFVHDPGTGRFRAYVKLNSYVNGLKRRSVGHCDTDTITSWPPPELILEPDAFDDRWVPAGTVQRTHFYGLSAFPCESHYLGFLWIFRATDPEGYYVGPVYSEIVSSHDGIHWVRQEGSRPAMLPLGPPGAWDDGQLYTARAPVRVGDRLWLYYGACDGQHGEPTKLLNCAIGLATLRKDGFASLDAGSTPGTLTTLPIAGAAGLLRVNFTTTAGGRLKAEVLDVEGQVLPGYALADCVPLAGDSVDRAVRWSQHAQLPAGGGPLRLRFELQNASLYSFTAGGDTMRAPSPAIVAQPSSRSATPGGTAVFSVQARGTPPLTYRWQCNGVDLADDAHYSGAAGPELTVGAADTDVLGYYRCVVTNAGGQAVSNEAGLSLRSAAFAGLGGLTPGAGCTVTGMSADGSVICGGSAGRAWIRTASAGMRDLGLPAGATSATAWGVGRYGSGIVAAADTNRSTSRAQRWDGDANGSGVFAPLPRVGGTREWVPAALGTDGSCDVWIVGSSVNGGDGNGREAVRYRQSTADTIAAPLPSSPPGAHDHSDFYGVSDDGVCVGRLQYPGTAPSGGARQAWFHVAAGGSTMLHTLFGLPSSQVEAAARCVSRNGRVKGGWSYRAGFGSNPTPAIWPDTLAPTAIPLPAGDNWGEVLACSGDGGVVGGYSMVYGSGQEKAFIWDAVRGTQDLGDLLSGSCGLNLSGWTLRRVKAMSGDGRSLAGDGLHDGVAEGWVVTFVEITPLPPTITRQPADADTCIGGRATFSVAAVGEEPLEYRWRKDGTDLNDGGPFSGTATAELTVTGTSQACAGAYRCLVRSGRGNILSSSATLSVQAGSRADFDGDCDVDRLDFEAFAACATGPGLPPAPACAPMDLDGDGDVDQADFGLFQVCYAPAGHPLPPGCGISP